jgi:hypothetical protein
MGKYGISAVEAVRLYTQRVAHSPRDAWERATSSTFGAGTASQCKGCPRDAFLGLCEEGLVKEIEPGNYTQSEKNKRYAVDAVAILRQRPLLGASPGLLWSEVLQGESKKHNSQMDVVIALWRNGLIQRTSL